VTDPIYRCPDHGFTTLPRCVQCGQSPEKVLSGDRRRRLSKFVSGALRHFPDGAGLELDEQGWTDYDDLAAVVTRKYDWAEREHVAAVVATDPKGRFERREAEEGTPTGPWIRATYGHSVDVDLDDGETDTEKREADEADEIPDRLYHGTAPGNLDSIRAEGLDSMKRNEVQLSETPAEAREVGSRHASEPVVLEVDVGGMVAGGLRVSKRGKGVFTADEVPPEYPEVRKGKK
jgi:putative RNA 2'-phosphotransferase